MGCSELLLLKGATAFDTSIPGHLVSYPMSTKTFGSPFV